MDYPGNQASRLVSGVAQTIVVCRLRTVLGLGRPRKTMACPTARQAAKPSLGGEAVERVWRPLQAWTPAPRFVAARRN
jgi:hypothetical protein